MTAQIITFPIAARRTAFAGSGAANDHRPRPPFTARPVAAREGRAPATAVQHRRIGERVFVHHRDRISTGVIEFAMGADDGWTFYRVRIDGGPHRGICAAVEGDRVFGIGEPLPDTPDPSGSARPTGRPRPCAEPTERSEGGREE
ncbi:hypothetical protein FKB34_01975 [Glycocaulis profundi]|nr:hypothetical protein FKB34_01975 [Glycocaulis profundi]